MIIVLKPGVQAAQVERLTEALKAQGVQVSPIVGSDLTVLGLVGDTSKIDMARIEANQNVEKVLRVQEPFKKANRMFHPDNSTVEVCGRSIGTNRLTVIAGPCSVESERQILTVAEEGRRVGGDFLRGGAFKPRSSPYSFQGLQYEGLELLKEARRQTGLPIVSELMSPGDIERFEADVDIIQVGARNMQNFDLLKQLGRIQKPVLLKRGLSATIEEWLMSAEYILAGGNEQVILCERGIRTFENYTRNTLDLSAIPAVKKLSHLPVLVDPSHSAGKWWMVESLSLAAVAVGADGLLIEVHNDPVHALCDGQQSLTLSDFARLMGRMRAVAAAVGREM
jgi:3-deoxy-7-phosphoheptulonate synthase